jgi:hypothetical protein
MIATSAAIAAAAVVMVAPAASADQDMGALAGCNPDKNVSLGLNPRGNFLDAIGGFFNCEGTPRFTLVLQRWNGFQWTDHVPRTGAWPSGRYVVTTYTCNGTATKKYRALMKGYRNGGDLWIRTSDATKVACG